MTVTLGRDANGNAISLEKEERLQGVYCIGSSGTGKSTLLTNMIQQDIKDNNGLCLLDPHGDLIERTIALMPPQKYRDVILLELTSPYAFGVNLFQCNDINDMEEVENTIAAVMHMLDKVYSISLLTPILNQWFLNITQTLLYNPPSSFLDIPRLFGDTPQDEKYRLKLAANVPNLQTKRFWQSFSKTRHHTRTIDSMSAIENKLDDFFRPVLKTIFGQEITTINMREIMDEGKILLVKMNARWESITKLVGSVIVGQILDAAYSRRDIPVKKRKFFSLYADEFQWFASSDFANLFSEARKYSIGVTIAHQTLEQVDPNIIATCKQARTIINFRVSGENAAILATQFDSTPPEPKMEESGRRKKQTPVRDIVGHLLKRGKHENPIVNRFVSDKLQELETTAKEHERKGYSSARFDIDSMNRFLYEAMTMDTPSPETVFPSYTACGQLSVFMRDFHAWWHDEINWSDTFLSAWSPVLYESVKIAFLDEIKEELNTILHLQKDAKHAKEAHNSVLEYGEEAVTARNQKVLLNHQNHPNDPLHYSLEGYIYRPSERETSLIQTWLPYNFGWKKLYKQLPKHDWFHIDIEPIANNAIEWETVLRSHDWMLFEEKGSQWWFEPSDLERKIQERIEKDHASLRTSVEELKAVGKALFANKILADSGEEEFIYRPGTQQTHADKQAEIANMLTRLPNMTAYVRVAGHEHTIEVKPKTLEKDERRAPLTNIIQTITQRNLEDGYIRERAEVEKEIEARQQYEEPQPIPSEPTPKQPNKPKVDASNLPTPHRRKLNS